MGYTNYWKQTKDFTNEEWDLVKKEYEYVLEICKGIIINEGKNPEEIVFNGNPIGDLNHETFILRKKAKIISYEGLVKSKKLKKQMEGLNFCKTATKPYDLAVWHLLFFAKNKTKAITEISRDR